MDFSRRNNLLYFKVLKKGTLDLAEADSDAFGRLLKGEPVLFSHMFGKHPDEDFGDALERVRRIRSKAKENFEERSIETLQLAVGMASWTDPRNDAALGDASRSTAGSATPAAPLLLMPLEIRPIKGGSDYSFRALVDDCVINPVLVEYARSNLGVHVAEPDGEDQGQPMTAWDRLHSLSPLIEELPDGSVRNTVVVGNFTYAKLTMVQDINDDLESMASHLVIQAICGVETALEQIRGHSADPPLDAPNRIAPANEFLILDADSSQNRIINAIDEGKTFAFDGPPGTGKSQTIANAIAVLVAMGKSVLFVAEKRAAIDVVISRLGAEGLSDLIMDYHGVGNKKKDLVQRISSVIPVLQAHDAKSAPYTAPKLEALRSELLSYASTLHDPDPSSGKSLHEYLVLKAEHEVNAAVECVLPRNPRLDFAQAEELDGLIRDLARFGGFATGRGPDTWRTVGSLGDGEAEAVLDLMEQVQRESLPDVIDYVDGIADLMNADAAAIKGSTLRLLASTMDLQGRHGTELLACNVKGLLTRLQPAEGPVASVLRPLVSRDVRKARSEVRRICGTWFTCRTAVQVLREADQILREIKKQKKPFNPTLDLNADERIRGFDGAWQRLEADCSNLDRLPIVVETLEIGLHAVANLLNDLLAAKDVAVSLNEAREVEAALRNSGLGRLLDASRKTNPGVDSICSSMWVAWLRQTIEKKLPRKLAIADGQSMSLERLSKQFRVEDRLHIGRSSQRILAGWRQRFADTTSRFPKQWTTLNSALNKKRNIPPLSKLVRESREVLFAVKPVWVMSPLSVSMLRPESQSFDVVIFDEASQIIPADAITSIKAGKQVVVAGDDQQLPPTTFFASSEPEDDSPETDEDYDDDAESIGDFESILQVFKSFITRPMQLQWHYRSRDERLIAYSNDKIYRTLTTFADSLGASPLHLVKVPFGQDAVGKRGSNDAEVQAVCDLIAEHVQENPDESLGVIALGINHAEAIEAELRRRQGSIFGFDSFNSHHESEPFFVKNLERVQGDERDAIILTVGYGHGPDGRVKYQFGPINGRHGTRRLNVATTRAKSRLTVVSTFGSDDLDEKMCSSGGRAFLKGYLRYIETGGTDFGAAPADAEMNAFERSIFEHLTRAGLDVVPQYGVGRYRIDFAIRDPRDPSRFALALECDGASYHSQPTARERDRLRQEALEQRGWKFHRIWSTDWFNFPERCIEDVLDRMRELD
jgi:very-short-patch-repair endonuclease